MNYTLWIVTPPNYIHSRCFEEVALSLQSAFRELGYECPIVTSSFECRGRTIVLGAHLLVHMPAQDYPEDMVIWNLEQIFIGSPWLTKEYVDLLRGVKDGYGITGAKKKLEVWDYSRSNIEVLAGIGVEAKFMEVGYAPCLTCIENNAEPDIDVLVYGSMNDRRHDIIDKLTRHNITVHVAMNCYGIKRDALIARSKVVLNVHYYESKVFEIVRCSYLMANRKAIVSETGFGGEAYEGGGVLFAPYDALVDSCVALLDSVERREELARRGFEVFSARKQVDFLRGVL